MTRCPPMRGDGGSVAYLDSSALVKLARDEDETQALRHALASFHGQASSELAVVEVLRAVPRRAEVRAVEALRSLALLRVERRLLLIASRLDPRPLRSLDAVHLATALSIGSALSVFVTYDRRLMAAAAMHGLPTAAPA